MVLVPSDAIRFSTSGECGPEFDPSEYQGECSIASLVRAGDRTSAARPSMLSYTAPT